MNLANMVLGTVSAVRESMATKTEGYHPSDPRLLSELGLKSSTAAGVTMDHGDMEALPAIYRGISILANKVAAVPFYVFKKHADETKTYEMDHPSWDAVVVDPHTELKKMDFIRTVTSWAIGWGNGIAHIDRPSWPRKGRMEFTPLLPDRTTPIRITEKLAKTHDIAGDLVGQLFYETRIGNEYFAYPADDCLHIRGLGSNPYWGYDICGLMVEALGGIKARQEFGHRFYGQGMNPAGYAQHPGQLSSEAAERLRESLSRGAEGMGRAHKIMLLEEGMEFKQMTVDPEKAQFLQGLEFDYRVAANIIGIKVHKLIDAKTNSFNSLEMAESEHRDDDILPWINQWSGEYEKKLLLPSQRAKMTHAISCDDEYLDGWVSFSDRATGVVEMHNNNMITRDEGRRKLNFGPSKDRDGSRFMSPMNIDFTDNKDLTSVPGATNANPKPPSDDPESPDNDDETETESDQSPAVADVLRDAWLSKIRVRVGKQAVKLSAKDTAEFIGWVDRMETETAPNVIQSDVDQLYSDIKTQLATVVNSALPDGKSLSGTVEELVANWDSPEEE